MKFSSRFSFLRSLPLSLGCLVAACEAPPEPVIEAHAAALNEPPAWAVVTCDQPTATSYSPFAEGQGNSALKRVTVTHTPGGVYNVTFPGLDKAVGGNFIVNAFGNLGDQTTTEADNRYCSVRNWSNSSVTGDVTLQVLCFLPSGAQTDAPFVAMYQRRSAPIDSFVGAYMWNNLLNITGPVNSVYSWNSSGGTNSITHVSTGVYKVTLPGVGQFLSGQGRKGTVQVSRYIGGGNGPGTCKVEKWLPSNGDEVVTVRCFGADAAASPQDSSFTLSYGNLTIGPPSGGFAWAGNPTATFYTPDSDFALVQFRGTLQTSTCLAELEVQRRGTGHYVVIFPGFAQFRFVPLVTAYGADSSYCKINNWKGAYDHTNTFFRNAAKYQCFTAAGAPVDTQFVAAYAGDYPSPGTTMPSCP